MERGVEGEEEEEEEADGIRERSRGTVGHKTEDL